MTADELTAMIAENDALWEVGDERAGTGYDAIMAERPTDPAALAVLFRWLIRERREVGGHHDDYDVLTHVAERLEAMAATA